jgi:hypothetical protein
MRHVRSAAFLGAARVLVRGVSRAGVSLSLRTASRARMSVHAFAFAMACMLAGCVPLTEPTARVLSVRVVDDDGSPLAGRAVEIDGLAATKTGPEGVAHISLSPGGSPRARVAVSCPAGSREVPPRHVPRVVTGGTARLELSFRCRPLRRELVVVVRAPGGEGLWLRADGEPLGRVAADGTLHVRLARAPDSEVRLLLDTGDLPLSPQNPVRELRVADRDELVVFDQPLTSANLRSRANEARASPSHVVDSSRARSVARGVSPPLP